MHKRTHDEQSKAAEEALDLRKDMMSQFEELKMLIKATAQARGSIEQKRLQENTTMLTASWLAKQTVYTNLIVSKMVIIRLALIDDLRNHWSILGHLG